LLPLRRALLTRTYVTERKHFHVGGVGGAALARFPQSARAAEASAMAGWLLLDDGDVPGAERLFARAARDGAGAVAASAQAGTAAIARRAATAP
jgi:hypothetical protein